MILYLYGLIGEEVHPPTQGDTNPSDATDRQSFLVRNDEYEEQYRSVLFIHRFGTWGLTDLTPRHIRKQVPITSKRLSEMVGSRCLQDGGRQFVLEATDRLSELQRGHSDLPMSQVWNHGEGVRIGVEMRTRNRRRLRRF